MVKFVFQEVWFQSLVGELRSHMPQLKNQNINNIGNIVTNSIKTLKNILKT